MSLFSTIAHHDKAHSRWSSPRWIGGVVLVLVAGIVLGYAISANDGADEATVAAQTTPNTLSAEEFYRINTEGFGLTEATGLTEQAKPPVDLFIYSNVDSFEDLLQMRANRYPVDSGFLEINTTGLDFPTRSLAEPSNGPR